MPHPATVEPELETSQLEHSCRNPHYLTKLPAAHYSAATQQDILGAAHYNQRKSAAQHILAPRPEYQLPLKTVPLTVAGKAGVANQLCNCQCATNRAVAALLCPPLSSFRPILASL